MIRKLPRLLLKQFAALVLLLSLTPSVLAIGIRPIRSEFSVEPGKTVKGEITVINETEKDFSAEPVIKVFYKNDETGFPVYPSQEDLDEVENFAEWIDVPQQPIPITAGDSATVEYTVTVPEDAEAGGKYATIAYQPVKDPNGGVAVNVRAASLLFVNVEGDIIKEGEITRFNTPETLKTDEPFNFEVTFQNTGNTHLKPNGWIKITNKKTGETLSQISTYLDPESEELIIGDEIPVNLRKKNVLPDSLRTFKSEWINGIEEGEFQALVTIKYDNQTGSISQTFDFEIKEDMAVEKFEINVQENAADFDLTLINNGTAYEKPVGVIKIVNNLGYQVDEIPLPEEMEHLAPGESVDLNLPWLSKAIPAGRYTATLEATYGFTEKIVEAEVKFGQIDRSKLFMGIGLGLAILIALLAIFVKRKPK